MTNQQIILKDGRRLGFAEYGHPQGRPILYFHGWPSSRLEAGMVDSAAQRLNIRIIAPDRPGFGRSDFQPTRKMMDWPQDVLQLAHILELDSFSVLALSAGSPYAAICALIIPQRLQAIGIVSGTAPTDIPGVADNMRPMNRRLLRIGRLSPWLFQVFSWPTVRALKRDRERFFDRQLADMPKPDRAVLARSDIREHLLNGALEAFRSGSRGAAWENALYARPWGFRLQDITREVHLWHGELDRNTPPAMGRYLANTIPNSKSRFYADEGHISLFVNQMEQILDVVSQEVRG